MRWHYWDGLERRMVFKLESNEDHMRLLEDCRLDRFGIGIEWCFGSFCCCYEVP